MSTVADKLPAMQQALKIEGFDGWLFYDFHGCNSLACNILEIPANILLTRRFFYWVPKEGTPTKLTAAIEEQSLNHLPGSVLTYKSWKELEEGLQKILAGTKKVAMEYSPRNSLPYLSKLDAGTYDLIKGYNVEVVSSAPFLHLFLNSLDQKKIDSHLFAANVLEKVSQMTWTFIQSCLQMDKEVTEFSVQQFILKEIDESDCQTESLPICAVNANSALPHYQPSQDHHVRIRPGDFILIDLWCKQKTENSIYADISQVAIACSTPTAKQIELFNLVKKAQDAAIALITERFKHNTPLMGCEVDALCRQIILDAGYGPYFNHRTGHNIDESVHGSGTHLDDFETHDHRMIQKGSCFSVEPGIYIPGEFGIRTEFDVCIDLSGNVLITGGRQKEIICI